MSHPKVFFHESDLNIIRNKYQETKKSIDLEVDSYFLNINSMDNLYYKVSLLDNKNEIYNSFKSLNHGLTNSPLSTKLNSRKPYVDPFSYSNQQSFDLMSSKDGFIIGVFALLFFFFTLIKQWRIKKIIGILVFLLIGLNLYNYFIKEPDFLNSQTLRINHSEYKKKRMAEVASIKYIDLYKPVVDKTTYKTTYEYDIEGYDDYVEGHVETYEKYGEGYVFNEYGDKIKIEVEWVGKGELSGMDEDNRVYKLKVSH